MLTRTEAGDFCWCLHVAAPQLLWRMGQVEVDLSTLSHASVCYKSSMRYAAVNISLARGSKGGRSLTKIGLQPSPLLGLVLFLGQQRCRLELLREAQQHLADEPGLALEKLTWTWSTTNQYT